MKRKKIGDKMDQRIEKLSKTIVDYSIDVKENEKVLIQYESSECNPLVKYLIKDIISKGGIPFTKLLDNELSSLILENSNTNIIDEMVKIKTFEVDEFDSFIRICYTENEYEDKDVPSSVRKELGKKSEEIDDIRINKRKWVLLNYPSIVDAYKARMKYDDFYNYSLNVMNVDYASLNEKIKPLKELMEKTDKVRIVGPNTDLTFSIKGLPAIPCCGKANIPDGELYTAPVKDSVNGIITYNTKSPYNGYVFNNISLGLLPQISFIIGFVLI